MCTVCLFFFDVCVFIYLVSCCLALCSKILHAYVHVDVLCGFLLSNLVSHFVVDFSLLLGDSQIISLRAPWYLLRRALTPKNHPSLHLLRRCRRTFRFCFKYLKTSKQHPGIETPGLSVLFLIVRILGLATLRGHQGPVMCVAWLRSSLHLASGSYDRTAKLWNVEVGVLRKRPREEREKN